MTGMPASHGQDLRYPIGPFQAGPPPDAKTRSALLSQLAEAPNGLRSAVTGLSEDQLNTSYRPGGWTVRQVVHHLADAQMNWYIRTRLAITEHDPHVSPWDEVRWSDLHDARDPTSRTFARVADGLYQRWVELFQSLTTEQRDRKLIHPDRGVFVLDELLPMQSGTASITRRISSI